MFILIGRRCDNLCASINLSTGHNIHWVSEMRCLARGLHCPVCDYEEGLYRSANNIFLGKLEVLVLSKKSFGELAACIV